jgi:hypothetical protein
MNRRAYLGGCAGVGLVALSGCLGAVAPRVARTEATPAFLMPAVGGGEEAFVPRGAHLVRPVDLDVDSGSDLLETVRVRGWLTGSRLVAANYNNTRSNRSGTATATTTRRRHRTTTPRGRTSPGPRTATAAVLMRRRARRSRTVPTLWRRRRRPTTRSTSRRSRSTRR